MSRVLIVDDDRNMMRLLATLLEMDGYEVSQAFGIGELRALLEVEKPDLVLMDVFLSDGDGLELLNEIRGSNELVDLPVVMTSGMNLSEQCAATGANAFLLKPYTPEQLVQTIESILGEGGE